MNRLPATDEHQPRLELRKWVTKDADGNEHTIILVPCDIFGPYPEAFSPRRPSFHAHQLFFIKDIAAQYGYRNANQFPQRRPGTDEFQVLERGVPHVYLSGGRLRLRQRRGYGPHRHARPLRML